MSAWFWLSSTATLFSRQRIYSFFFLRHSLAASLEEDTESVHGSLVSWLPHLFFMSLTSLLRPVSSPPTCEGSPGDLTMPVELREALPVS